MFVKAYIRCFNANTYYKYVNYMSIPREISSHDYTQWLKNTTKIRKINYNNYIHLFTIVILRKDFSIKNCIIKIYYIIKAI